MAEDMIDTSRLMDLAISPSGFAFDPRSGQSFAVNGAGIVAIEHLQRGVGLEETARQLTLVYDVAEDVACGAVEGFIRQLARYLS